MLKELTFIENVFDASSWETTCVEDVLSALQEKYKTFPLTARLYNKNVALSQDITPKTDEDCKYVATLDGPFFVVVYPAAPVVVAWVAVALAAISFLVRPKIPNVAIRNTQQSSPNNALSGRSNRARPNGRVPDIFGTVTSTPDLLALPYSIFKNHIEYENAYMCIGRGAYEIPVEKIKDGQTAMTEIEGASAEVYGPFTSPNSGDSPQVSIGSAIGERVVSAVRSKSVNGQVLLASNEAAVSSANGARFVTPNKIEVDGVDLTETFDIGDTVTVTTSSRHEFRLIPPENLYYEEILYNLSGTYEVETVAAGYITLVDPELVNDAWDWGLADGGYVGGHYGNTNVVLENGVGSGGWVGPFTINVDTLTEVIGNYIALNGIYKDDGTTQFTHSVEVQMGVTPVDVNGTAIGFETFYEVTIDGSATVRTTRAKTLRQTTGYTGPVKVRSRRLTPKDNTFEGQVVDEVKWRDLYGISPVDQDDFGNVTTVQTLQQATESALSISERQLNMLVTRKLPQRVSGSTFTSELYSTRNAADIISFVCLDPKIGNRTVNEIDFDSIYDAVDDVLAEFGVIEATEFSYTIDSDNLSFEEIIAMMASAIFCTAYRDTSIKLWFERATVDSKLLFNHRNKVPNSETQSVTFGNIDTYDGIQYDYVSPIDDAVLTLYVDADGVHTHLADATAVKPRSVESVGIRSYKQAYLHACREFNKLFYQNRVIEFEGLSEASLLILNQRILNADNSRQKTQDGYVKTQVGLMLELSQPVVFEPGEDYLIYLQHVDASVEMLSIEPGPTEYNVILGTAPAMDLSLADDAFVKAAYIIVKETDDKTTRPFLVVEKTNPSNFTYGIKAINYDVRYYQNDGDFKDFDYRLTEDNEPRITEESDDRIVE